jgi:citrate synthase
MSDGDKPLRTAIAKSDEQSITVRDRDLTGELMGEMDFGTFCYLHVTGEEPNESESRLFNAMLVAIAEHGVTPSVIATRLTYDSAPEAVQGAVASGLLGAGSTFLGSMENAGHMLQDGVERLEDGKSMNDVAERIVEENDRLPGFGHPEHTPTDPRTDRLFELLDEEGMSGRHRELMLEIQDVAEDKYDTHLVLNATGAIAVVVSEIGFDPSVGRGIALIARSAGLVGHLNEEIEEPMARDIWQITLDNLEYTGEK